MINKDKRTKDNERLIGKTITWSTQGDDWVGLVIKVKDHETVIAAIDKIEYEVNLFDITSTK